MMLTHRIIISMLCGGVGWWGCRAHSRMCTDQLAFRAKITPAFSLFASWTWINKISYFGFLNIPLISQKIIIKKFFSKYLNYLFKFQNIRGSNKLNSAPIHEVFNPISSH